MTSGRGRERSAEVRAEHQKAPPADAFEVQTPASEGTIADVVQVAGTADVAGIGDVAGLGDVDDANHLMGATDLTIAPVEATEAANTGFPAGDILADLVEAVVLDTTGVVAAFTVGPAVMLGAAGALGGAYASEAVVEGVGEVAGAVGDVLEDAGSAITDAASDIEDAASDAVDGVEDFLF